MSEKMCAPHGSFGLVAGGDRVLHAHLSQPIWQRQHREQAERLEEHQAIENKAAGWEAKEDPNLVKRRVGSEVSLDVWDD